ncbi:hypothetical protein FJZ36_02605 [Candidatus Poribacteria bacterium]|nr:hypothetical protein [Candidatus Poribacteria bacterium]
MRRTVALAVAAMALVGSTAWAANFKVLILIGDARSKEMDALEAIKSAGAHNFTYERVVIEGGTFDGNMRGAQIIWMPWNAPGHDGLYFMAGSEAKVRDWVKAGGGIWISAFDDNFKDAAGKQVGGWMPIDEHPVTVQNTADSDVEITADGAKSGLFSKPNAADMNAMVLDDNFAGVDKSWVVLAKRKDNGEVAAAYLPYGKGVYVTACIDTRDDGRTEPAKPLLGNGLFFIASMLSAVTPVEPEGRLAATWAGFKSR